MSLIKFWFSYSVSDAPVDIFEQTPETDIILRTLGNLPIHIRQAQNWSSAKHNSSQVEKAAPNLLQIFPANSDFSDLNFSVIDNDQNNEIKLVWMENISKTFFTISMFQDTDGAEELSVKTLANMFDFKQGESTIAKNAHKLRDSKINKIAQEMTLNVTNCSECWFYRNW